MQTTKNGTRTRTRSGGTAAQTRTPKTNAARRREDPARRPPWRTVLLLAGMTLCVAFFTWLYCLHVEKTAPRQTTASSLAAPKASPVVGPSPKAEVRAVPKAPDTTPRTTRPRDAGQPVQAAPVQEPVVTPASEPLFTPAKSPASVPGAAMSPAAPEPTPATAPAREPTTMELRELEARLTSKARPFTVGAMGKARNGVARITQTADGLRIAASQRDGTSSVVLKGAVHLIDRNTFSVTGTIGLTKAGTALKPWSARFVFKADARMKGWRNDAAGMLVWF